MFIIKRIYTIIIFLILLCVICSTVLSFIRKTKVSLGLARLHTAVFFSLSSFLITLYISDPIAAGVFYGLYFFSLDYALFSVLKVLVALQDDDKYEKHFKVGRQICLIVCALDAVLLFTNIKTGFCFYIFPNFQNKVFLSWDIILRPGEFYHALVCYGFSIYIAVYFIKSAVSAKFLYKRKFILPITLLGLTLIVNAGFTFFSNTWKFDYSMIFYGLFDLFTAYMIMYSEPSKLQKNMLSIASENISDAIFCYDCDGQIIYENKIAREMSDCWLKDHPELQHTDTYGLKNIFDYSIRPSSIPQIFPEWLTKYLNSSFDVLTASETIELNGEDRYYNVDFKRLRDSQLKYSGAYIRFLDRTEEVKKRQEQDFRTSHDELTGFLNRNAFFSEVEAIIRKQPDIPRYLVATNIKNFKIINDLFGSTFGDNVLRRQAEMMSLAKYNDCIYGRISGDKFAMLINKADFNLDLARKNTDRLQFLTEDVNYKLKVGLGVYEIANPYENVHLMFDKAQLAIKSIKLDNSTNVAVYDTLLMNELMKEKNIISEFKYALLANQFCIYLQPQIRSSGEKCIGAEALVRWDNSQNGSRSPAEFISILEKSGLIYQLDNYIWRQAINKLSEWQKNGNADMYISVNISAKDFYYGDIYDTFVGLVEEYEVPPSKLNLEITESFFISDNKDYQEILTKLRNYGFKIEMDDFGCAYSSLTSLNEIKMDVLKIDMAFLQKTEHEDKARIIIESIVKMAKELGMTIVTEGVEKKSQVEFLKRIGVDIFQGYLYSKPISVELFEKKYLGGE